MIKFDLQKINKIFFLGIGGIGISAIARMMFEEGKSVSGSDTNESEVVKELRNLGIPIEIGQHIDLIPKEVDLIIYTIALEVHDPSLLQKVKNLQTPSVSYPEMLGIVTQDKFTIAIAGTHGKTTTTAMIGHVLKEAGRDPSMIVGSLLINSKSNFVQGKSNLFVIEACEYKRSFLQVSPKIAVITNVDEDHLDYYKDISDIKNAFEEFVEKVPEEGVIVVRKNDPHIEAVVSKAKASIVDYGAFITKRALKLPGEHNQLDAAAAAAVCYYLGIDSRDIDTFLETFPGTSRRFEYKGELKNGAKIYDDYGHHPKEIITTLKGFRELYPKDKYRLTVIFQPHLFSRTKHLFADFANSFMDADTVIILPIYAAREEDDGSINSELLVEAIKRNRGEGNALSFAETIDVLSKKSLNKDDIIVTIGAGEAFKVGDELLLKLG